MARTRITPASSGSGGGVAVSEGLATREAFFPIGDVSARTSKRVFKAPAPCKILDCGLLVGADRQRDASAYWGVVFRQRHLRPYSTAVRDSLAATALHVWPLDEYTGTSAIDRVGSMTGTHTNGPTVGQDGPPNVDAELGVSYDGTNDYTSFAAVTLPWGNTLTAEFWIKPDSLTTAMTIIGNENATTSPRFAIDATGHLIVAIGGTVVAQETSQLLRLGQWNHVVISRNGTGTAKVAMTVNGFVANLTTSAGDFTDQSATWTLGRRAAGSEQLAGDLSMVALHNSVVSPDTARSRLGVVAWKSSKTLTGAVDTYTSEPFIEGYPWTMAPVLQAANVDMNADDQLYVDLEPFGSVPTLQDVTAYVEWEPI